MISLSRRLANVFAAAVFGTGLGGCASTPPTTTDTLQAYLQQVSEAGILPAPKREIRLMESVLWLNTSKEKPVVILLRRPPGTEVGCATQWGFRPGAESTTITGLLPPGAAAGICFHQAGTYEYEVTGLDRPLEGSVVVLPKGPAVARAGGSNAK